MTINTDFGQSRHGSDQQDSPTTADVAKDQAAGVAGGAAAAAQQVTGVAKEQAGAVVSEVGDQVKAFVGQAKSEFSDQAQTQQERAAAGLHSVADQLGAMAQGSQEPGVATDLAHQAAEKAHQFADWLDARNPGEVLTDVKSFARHRPGMFLLVALGAGIAAGRFARGLTADADPDSDSRAAADPDKASESGRTSLSASEAGFVTRPELHGAGSPSASVLGEQPVTWQGVSELPGAAAAPSSTTPVLPATGRFR